LPACPVKIKQILATAILLLTILPGITLSGFNSAPVKADGEPDLIVQDITLSPAEPAIDDSVTITVSVKNQGTAAAGQSYVVCYVDSTILGTQSFITIEAGTMATKAFTWKAEAGSHDIKAIADSTEAITETDETNNTRTYAITTRAADLIVQSISWSPASPSLNDSVVFSVIIKNQGSASSRITNINLYIDGNSRGYRDIGSINPSDTLTATYNWIALSGQHVIKVVVDEPNYVKENNETNNDYTSTFSTAPPDLVIEQINWSPQNVSKNDTISINATVKNQGTGRADACHLAYFIDGELKSTLQVGALEAGESCNITFSWKATSEKHDIKTVIDYYQNVAESDENNNEKTANLATLVPDLIVTGITWSPVDAAVGDTVTFNATIKNIGGGRSEKAHAACYIDGSFISAPDIPEIDAGEEWVLIFQWVATGGSHPISVMADYDNMLAETLDDNNKLAATISIIPPDLFIPSIGWSPTNFAIDETVTFSVNITNQGGGKAENFYVAYYLDDVLLHSQPVSVINSGASLNTTCTWKALNGRHIFKAIVDYNKAITEENENNNEYSIAVAPNMPDLDVSTVTWSPADIKAGSEVKFDIVIKNLGTLNAGPTRVAYYVDDAVAGFSDIGQLNAGAATTVHFTWGAMVGLHKISIVADSTNKVFEIDETNNTKVVSLPPPDLIVQDITWSPGNAATGDKVTITATIKNQGGSRSPGIQVTCYIDGMPLATKDLAEIDPAGSATSTFDWTALAGGHKVKVSADVTNRATESDETNNDREVAFGTLTPDLIVQDISWLMENPLTDDKVAFTITVKNQGSGKAAASRLTYAVDNMLAMTEDIPAIPAGETAALDFSSILKAGPHTVDVTLDPENKINELDETNNTKTLAFSSIVPDLTVITISLTPANAVPGDNVTITVKVENRGKDKAVNPNLSLSIDGAPAGEADIAEIDIGAIVSRDFNWKAVAGSHEITAYADIGTLIPESNETNNSRTRTVSIENPAAPVPKTISLSTASTANKGFIASWWWLLLLAAALLGGAAFVSMLRAFRKG
jgi:subtilase family serine protease